MIEKGKAQYASKIWLEYRGGDYDSFCYSDYLLGVPDFLHAFRANQATPVVLSACRESNAVASHFYTRAFSSLGAIAETYFDFRNDVLYISTLILFGWGEGGHSSQPAIDDLQRVERVLLNHLPLTRYGGRNPLSLKCLLMFEALEEVLIGTELFSYQRDEPNNWKALLKSSTWQGKQCTDLAPVKISCDEHGFWSINGLRICSCIHNAALYCRTFDVDQEVQTLRTAWDESVKRTRPEKCGKYPKFTFTQIMSQAEQKQLLHDLAAPGGNHNTSLMTLEEQEQLIHEPSAWDRSHNKHGIL
jgi:hypothetical protein